MKKIAIVGPVDIERALKSKTKHPEGRKYVKKIFDDVYSEIESYIFEKYDKDNITLVSGMARGVDEVVAIMAIRHNIPLIIVVPVSTDWHKNRGLYKGMKAGAIYYDKILKYKKLTIYNVTDKGKHQYINFARNEQLIKMSDVVYSYYNNLRKTNGTKNAIWTAKKFGLYGGNLYKIKMRYEL